MGSIKNINSVISELKKYGKEAEQLVDGITEQTARKMELEAKKLVPANFSDLGQSILAKRQGFADWKVIADATNIAPYAAYVEFGTGGLVSVPDELKEIAISWKGKGIRKINLRPRPYMYPSLIMGRKIYLESLQKALSKYGNVK